MINKGTFNTIGQGSATIGGHFPIWSRVREVYQGGGQIDASDYSAGDLIPAGTMVHFAGPGAEVTVYLPTAFSASSTYAVGDYVTYNNKLYICKTAITTAAAWDATKWTEKTSDVNGLIMDDVLIPDGAVLATCAVVRAGRIYADRAGLPTGIEANLPMIEFVHES